MAELFSHAQQPELYLCGNGVVCVRIRGRAVFATVASDKGESARRAAEFALPAIRPGFKRVAVQREMNAHGNELTYDIVDEQVAI